MSKAFELAEGWPHKHMTEYPDEVHISPRSAYFTRDGKVMSLPLEKLDQDDIDKANVLLAQEGVDPFE